MNDVTADDSLSLPPGFVPPICSLGYAGLTDFGLTWINPLTFESGERDTEVHIHREMDICTTGLEATIAFHNARDPARPRRPWGTDHNNPENGH